MQDGLIDKALETVGMVDCNVKWTPANVAPLGTDISGLPWKEEWSYALVVGMLMFLGSNAFPEIQMAVHQCAQFTHRPQRAHEETIKHMCWYLKGAKGKGLTFLPTTNLDLNCYVDADFSGLYGHEDLQDPNCVRSWTGYVLTLWGCPVIWNSKLQTEIALSTTEAEYIALSQSMRKLLPLRCFVKEVCTQMDLLPGSTQIKSTVFEDNSACLTTAQAEWMSPQTNHIAIKYHFFQSCIGPNSGITLAKIDTLHQKADILTKGMTGDQFEALRRLLCGW